MKIRSQNKELLVLVNDSIIQIQTYHYINKEVYAIEIDRVILGRYPTKEMALKVLDKLQKEPHFFQMPTVEEMENE